MSHISRNILLTFNIYEFEFHTKLSYCFLSSFAHAVIFWQASFASDIFNRLKVLIAFKTLLNSIRWIHDKKYILFYVTSVHDVLCVVNEIVVNEIICVAYLYQNISK